MELEFSVSPVFRVCVRLRDLERLRGLLVVLGYSDYRVLAQLGFDLARAWLALAWLGWAVTI